MNENQKITERHLSKTAYLYIRQSTLRQVKENTESTIRQYALRDKLASLGWDSQMIEIIDCDLGYSGKTAGNREGFKQLVANVANGTAGAVACIEASRLSRSSSDWGRLIEYCAMTDTLLIDADGIYNPNDFNDRLLLGLKGTMSEAELHFLQERMRGGILNKARRGELKENLPIGYLYDGCGRIIKDDDIQIREAVELFFRVFRIVRSAHGMVAYYKGKGYHFPKRIHSGPQKGEVIWCDMTNSRASGMLHNPIYAGVYYYGKKQTVWTKEGKKTRSVKREDWHVYLKDHHEAYISHEDYEFNEKTLLENSRPCSLPDGGKTLPREGAALLQGIVICGKCGHRMSIRYMHKQKGASVRNVPVYTCQRQYVENGGKYCQHIIGTAIDELISSMVKEKLTPEAVKMSVEVQKEVYQRKSEQARYFQLQVEKGRYEADIARRRFMNVDPDNRLVALELESAWNLRLAHLQDAEKKYDDEIRRNQTVSGSQMLEKTVGLAENFQKAWDSPLLTTGNKKKLIRYLIEDVTLTKGADTTLIQIRFRGGTSTEMEMENPQPSYKRWQTTDEVRNLMREKGEEYTARELAELLNSKGYRSGKGQEFTAAIVRNIMHKYGIQTKKERYLSIGYFTTKEKAAQLDITPAALRKRVEKGTYYGEVVHATDGDLLFKP